LAESLAPKGLRPWQPALTQSGVAIVPVTVGFDAKDFRRVGGKGNEFFALIGVGVEVPDPAVLQEHLTDALGEAFDKRGHELTRSVHKRMHLLRLFGPDEGVRATSEVIHAIAGQIARITVFYTIIQPWKVPQIWTYKRDRTWGAETPLDFMHQLSASYVHVSAWKYTDGGRADGKNLSLDGFQGQQTEAWDELCQRELRVYYRGDTCNPVLSAADLIVATIDEEVGRNRFGDESIERALRALNLGIPWTSEYIGIPHLKWIKPYTRKMIDTTRYLAHPVYYILSEDRPENLNNKQARMQLELSPLYGQVADAACDSDGCVKLYDATEDIGGLTRRGARVIYYGEKGRALGASLETMYGVKPIDIRVEELR
jgi:hypothetical protein